MSAHTLEVSLLGVGTVLRLEMDAWSMVKWLRQATNEYAPPPFPPLPYMVRHPRGRCIVLFFSHFYFSASGQAVVTGVVPSPPWFLPSYIYRA